MIKEDWVQVEIEDIFKTLENGKEINQGWSPQCKNYPSPSDDIWGVLKTTAIQKNEFWEHENKELPKDKEVRAHLEVKVGDIILTCAGPRNRCGVACTVIKTRPKLLLSGKMYRFRPDERAMTTEFLTFFLQTQESWLAIDKMKTGTSDSGLNLTHARFRKLPVRVAPLPEQRAIVSKIEELFSDLDKGIDDLKKAQAQLVIFRQAVLKKAFEGELTKGWREQQTNLPTADELLEQIKEDFEQLVKEKKKKKEKALPKIKKEDIPHLIPNTWIWCNLGDITWFINGDRGKNYPNRNEYVASGIPWINTGHIEPDGSLSADKMNFITREKFNTLRSGKILPGDLVYCLRGATFGKTAYVVPYTEGSIASSLMIIRSNDKLNNTYLYHFLTSVEGKKQLQRFDNGTAQPNLSANMVRSYTFPLPSTDEQHQIVQEIESRLSVCDKVEQSITESLEKAKALRQSILKKAFEGTLLSVEEIKACKAAKDYEPASILLKKIKAEKKKP